MACPIQQLVWFLKDMIIKITVYPISFVFFEFSKFVLVLVLAFWITVGIFSMWESIMPEAARRLSAAAAAVVANSSGLMPQTEDKDKINEKGSYPFVVDIPNASSAMETKIEEELPLEKEISSTKEPQLETAISEPLKKEPSSSANENLPQPIPSQLDKGPESEEIPKAEPITEADSNPLPTTSPSDSPNTVDKEEASPEAPEQPENAPPE